MLLELTRYPDKNQTELPNPDQPDVIPWTATVTGRTATTQQGTPAFDGLKVEVQVPGNLGTHAYEVAQSGLLADSHPRVTRALHGVKDTLTHNLVTQSFDEAGCRTTEVQTISINPNIPFGQARLAATNQIHTLGGEAEYYRLHSARLSLEHKPTAGSPREGVSALIYDEPASGTHDSLDRPADPELLINANCFQGDVTIQSTRPFSSSDHPPGGKIEVHMNSTGIVAHHDQRKEQDTDEITDNFAVSVAVEGAPVRADMQREPSPAGWSARVTGIPADDGSRLELSFRPVEDEPMWATISQRVPNDGEPQPVKAMLPHSIQLPGRTIIIDGTAMGKPARIAVLDTQQRDLLDARLHPTSGVDITLQDPDQARKVAITTNQDSHALRVDAHHRPVVAARLTY